MKSFFLKFSNILELFTTVKKRMAAGVPELVKHVSTIDSARVLEDGPVTEHGSAHWTAEELNTLGNLMGLGNSNEYIAAVCTFT